MSTDRQTYHKKYPCPNCGELLHFRREQRRELFCPICGLTDTYRFDLAEIFFAVQSQRRKEQGSVGKKILAEYQRSPVLINRDYWLVYDLGYYAKIYYDTQAKEYEYINEEGQKKRFGDIAELIEIINKKIDKSWHKEQFISEL